MSYFIIIAITILATILIGAALSALRPSRAIDVVLALSDVWTNVLMFGEKVRAKIGKAFNPED